MELDHKLNQNEPPHISGSYIRNLVKQIKSKDSGQNSGGGATPAPPQKKQVRRRLHTTRPYQERLLNMAEARREIVTALKFHRAAMKKAAGEPANEPPPDPPVRSCPKPRKIPKISPSSSSENTSFCYPPFPMAPFSVEDIALPEQTLGLNLNFHDFKNIDLSLFQNGGVSHQSNSSSSSSLSMAADQEAPRGGGLHVAVGDEEMAEIRSIGEKHEVEWSDKMNLVTSARWFRFMKNSEEDDEEDGYQPFDRVLEFPDWMKNGNEEQLLNDSCSSDDYYRHDHALPCMDIGEFEGMDGEWLA